MTATTDAPEIERTYTVPQLGKVWGVQDETLYKMIREGKLRCVRLGRLIRVPQSAVDEFLAGE